jgi:uncharacterized membrane protein YhaH (DUF805 family)
MAALLAGHSFRFLFRTDQGRIDSRTWWRGTLLLGAILLPLTLIWFAISGYAQRDLKPDAVLVNWPTLVTYVYLLLYAFAVILIAICHYNLSAKRFRDRGLPSSLAGLLPFLALFAGAMHWLYPRVSEAMPYWLVFVSDVLLIATVVFNLIELNKGSRGA